MQRAIPAVLLLLALAAPVALAQEPDPTVNESDMDTSPPPEDDQYLDDAESEYASDANGTSGDDTSAGDPTLTESDFDMSGPSASDEAYLDEAQAQYATDASAPAGEKGSAPAQGADAGSDTPGVLAPMLIALLAFTALALGRRR